MSIVNLVKSKLYNIYKDFETTEHKLIYVFLEITRKCNLSCTHCGSDCSKDSSMNEMTTESWLSIIDYLNYIYKPFFVITGGEPLVHEGFSIIVNHLKQKNARWGMVTNGMLLHQNKLDELIHNNIESITVSLDGDEKSHLYLRKHPQSWFKVNKAIELIGKSKIIHKDVVTCVYPSNLDKLNETAELLINNGITSWRLFRIFPKGSAKNKPELYLDFNQSQLLIQWIADNRDRLELKGLKISFSCEGYIPFELDIKVRNEPFFCRAGINIASILADGTITGCNNNGEDFYQGNISKDNFQEVWNNRFAEFRDKNWLKTGECMNCSHWKNCQGSSIHLRDKLSKGPHFCYVKNNERPLLV